MNTVIVDLKGKYAAALTDTGEIKHIFNNNYEIGQEIKLYDIKEITHPYYVRKIIHRVVAVAAAVIVLALGSLATAYAIPYGTVSLESDSSVEYTINCFDYVINVNALNEKGEELLSEMNVSRLCHHKIDDAVKTTVEQIKSDIRFDTDKSGVEISAHTGSSEHTDKLQQDLDTKINQNTGFQQKSEERLQESDHNTLQNNDAKEKPDDITDRNAESKQENFPENKNNDHAEISQKEADNENKIQDSDSNVPFVKNNQGIPEFR